MLGNLHFVSGWGQGPRYIAVMVEAHHAWQAGYPYTRATCTDIRTLVYGHQYKLYGYPYNLYTYTSTAARGKFEFKFCSYAYAYAYGFGSTDVSH